MRKSSDLSPSLKACLFPSGPGFLLACEQLPSRHGTIILVIVNLVSNGDKRQCRAEDTEIANLRVRVDGNLGSTLHILAPSGGSECLAC